MQKILLNLLSIVEARMKVDSVAIKIFNVMTEMLQNIIKHADNQTNEKDWKPGIFLICDKQGEIVLTAGNNILKGKKESLKQKIDYINALNEEELLAYYYKLLMNSNVNNAETTGLGLIDMRRKSKKAIEYQLYDENAEFTFFIIQVSIQK